VIFATVCNYAFRGGCKLSELKTIQDLNEGGDPLPPDFLRVFIKNATLLNVKKGEHILTKGDNSNDVYVIINGEVQFVLFSESGKEVILRDFGPNRIFGEMAALNGSSRSVSVIASENTSLVRMTGKEFCALLHSMPEACFWLSQQLALRIENLTHKTYNMATQSVSTRIIGELIRLSENHGSFGETSIIKDLPSHAKLAARLGTHREAVTREIGRLKKDGIIKKSGRYMIIVAPKSLSELYARMIS